MMVIQKMTDSAAENKKAALVVLGLNSLQSDWCFSEYKDRIVSKRPGQ